MSPSSTPPSDDPPDACPREPSPHDVLSLIDSLKKEVSYDRIVYVKSHMEENSQELADVMKSLHMFATERMHSKTGSVDRRVDLLMKRQKDAIDMQNDLNTSDGDSDSSNQEEEHASAVLLGSSIAVKKAVQPIKLPAVERLPPYTTWIFLDRNQRMMEDQSVVGRRRIYYDQNGGEALIASDSEEEVIEEEEEKKLFVKSEDYILRMTIKEFGISDTVLDLLAHSFSRKPCDIKARYEDLVEEKSTGITEFGNIEGINLNLDKDLDAALDSFDNLFCRRCYVFDCKLHGCSQDLVFPVEKPLPCRFPDEEKGACGNNCYKLTLKPERVASAAGQANLEEKYDESETMISTKHAQQLLKASQSESGSPKARNISESSDSENHLLNGIPADCLSPRKIKLSGELGSSKRNCKRLIEHVPRAMGKKLKKLGASLSNSVSTATGSKDPCLNPCKENKDVSSSQRVKSTGARRSKRKESLTEECDNSCQVDDLCQQLSEVMSKQPPTNSNGIRKGEIAENNLIKLVLNDDKTWKQIEKDLYDKGLQIFGNNSCLISRNLMNGLKTCREVFQYMNHCEHKLSLQGGHGSPAEGSSKGDGGTMGKQVRRRSRFLRRKGKARRLKYSWKSAGYSSMKKRISEKDQPCRHYNPCGCKIACGKDCPCVISGTCCEKYCG
ncbi:histone modifying enzyme [Lithospermum erythrorhizon]|uniref:Histone modifying enzyme n=1 Tax=Lithospermum erythrorhizon TaxID=34254 RepID=A0AAV3RIX5_LITER